MEGSEAQVGERAGFGREGLERTTFASLASARLGVSQATFRRHGP